MALPPSFYQNQYMPQIFNPNMPARNMVQPISGAPMIPMNTSGPGQGAVHPPQGMTSTTQQPGSSGNLASSVGGLGNVRSLLNSGGSQIQSTIPAPQLDTNVDAIMPSQEELDSYLPQFQVAGEEGAGDAAGVGAGAGVGDAGAGAGGLLGAGAGDAAGAGLMDAGAGAGADAAGGLLAAGGTDAAAGAAAEGAADAGLLSSLADLWPVLLAL